MSVIFCHLVMIFPHRFKQFGVRTQALNQKLRIFPQLLKDNQIMHFNSSQKRYE